MIPMSIRKLYARVEGTQDTRVVWSASGGCTLAKLETDSAEQIVTAPTQGASCTYNTHDPALESPNFVSSVSCKVAATSKADPAKSSSVVIPICAPTIELTTFPAVTVLFKNQVAVIQSDLRGSVETSVTWSVTKNPGSAGAFLGGSANRHAIFSASVPGTYVVTATSNADRKKIASTTIYVTEHEVPSARPGHTEPVDCTAVGSGKTYEVGPSRAFPDLNRVPWSALKAGDTVRVHNDDVTGSSPTTYHQNVLLSTSGNAAQPLRICGVPDAQGVKPIIDGEDASPNKDSYRTATSLTPLGLVNLYDGLHKFDDKADGNFNVLIEGLHIRNAKSQYHFVNPDTLTSVPYNDFAACIRVQTGRNITVRGNELENCSQGVFTNAQTPEGNIVYDLTVQGNYIHSWGSPKNGKVHGLYLQSIGLQVQFNYFGEAATGGVGNVIKSRSVLSFIRWNYISQLPTTGRALDLVEPQAFNCYVIPFEFAVVYHRTGHTDCGSTRFGASADSFSPNRVAANYEAYQSDYVYGNIFDDLGSASAFVHYGYDQQTEAGPKYDRRAGTLYYWNNTHVFRKASGVKRIFDVAAPDDGHSYGFPSVESINNIFVSVGGSQFQWTPPFWAQIRVDSNWMQSGYLLPNRHTKDNYQGGTAPQEFKTCDPYGNCAHANGHMLWARNGQTTDPKAAVYSGVVPISLDTFQLISGGKALPATLPPSIRNQPSNMEYSPTTNRITFLGDVQFLGALK